MRTDCACLYCILACVRSPGRLVPDDVGPIAQHLGIPAVTLVTDYLEDAGDGVTLRPRLTPDGCVFLRDQRCTIHAVKPYECREARHDLTQIEVARIERHVRAAWTPTNP